MLSSASLCEMLDKYESKGLLQKILTSTEVQTKMGAVAFGLSVIYRVPRAFKIAIKDFETVFRGLGLMEAEPNTPCARYRSGSIKGFLARQLTAFRRHKSVNSSIGITLPGLSLPMSSRRCV